MKALDALIEGFSGDIEDYMSHRSNSVKYMKLAKEELIKMISFEQEYYNNNNPYYLGKAKSVRKKALLYIQFAQAAAQIEQTALLIGIYEELSTKSKMNDTKLDSVFDRLGPMINEPL